MNRHRHPPLLKLHRLGKRKLPGPAPTVSDEGRSVKLLGVPVALRRAKLKMFRVSLFLAAMCVSKRKLWQDCCTWVNLTLSEFSEISDDHGPATKGVCDSGRNLPDSSSEIFVTG